MGGRQGAPGDLPPARPSRRPPPPLTCLCALAPFVCLCVRSVQVTVVDLLGRRHVVRGTTGQSVVDLLQAHLDTLGEDGEQGWHGGCSTGP